MRHTWLVIFSLFTAMRLVAQGTSRVEVGYFDLDDKPDSCYYVFNNKTAAGPVYNCKLVLSGTGRKERTFTIGVRSRSLVISSCGVGCIRTYEWIAGMQNEEYEAVYHYDKERDTWVLSSRSVNGRKIKLSAIEQQSTIGDDRVSIKDIYKQVQFTDRAIAYRADIQVGAAGFEFYVNDVLVAYYFGNANGTFNTSAPVNNAILRSGKQKWKLILFPPFLNGKQESAISPNLIVDIRIEGLKDSPEGAGTLVPPARLIAISRQERGHVSATTGKPSAVYTGEFNAAVPYTLLGWSNSKDLTKEDGEKLLQEVLEVHRHYLDLLKNKDIAGIEEMVCNKEQETQQANFDDQAGSMENYAAYTGVFDLPEATFLPIEKYRLKIFGDGRLVTLVRSDFPNIDEPVIRIRYLKNGRKRIKAMYGVFHKPAGSGRLEMIR